MSDVQGYGSGLAPPRPPPRSLLWYCNSCRRQNPTARYVCQHCMYGDTYDLCARFISGAHRLHPGHRFNLESGTDRNRGCKVS